MILLSIVIGVAFFLLLVLVAIHLVIKAGKPDEPAETPMIHASGIYSILRRSPRDTISQFKPSVDNVIQYLRDKNEDIMGKRLEEADKKALAAHWREQMDQNIGEVEAGDRLGIEFYYYDFTEDDPICKGTVNKGHFVTREEIFRFPQTIPPFHIGCRCLIKAHQGLENLRETTRLGMRPLFTGQYLPPLPPWSDILKLS